MPGQATTFANAAGGAGGIGLFTGSTGGTSATGVGGAGGVAHVLAGTGGAATAGTGNGGAGGDCILEAGTGGTSAGGSAGAAGTVRMRLAGTDYATLSPLGSGGLFSHLGGLAVQTVTKTASYAIDSGSTPDCIIFSNITSTGKTITLPAPTAGRVLFVFDISGSMATDTVGLAQHASEKINGVASTYTLASNFGAWMVTSNGTDWLVAGL